MTSRHVTRCVCGRGFMYQQDPNGITVWKKCLECGRDVELTYVKVIPVVDEAGNTAVWSYDILELTGTLPTAIRKLLNSNFQEGEK